MLDWHLSDNAAMAEQAWWLQVCSSIQQVFIEYLFFRPITQQSATSSLHSLHQRFPTFFISCTHKLITRILWHTKIYISCWSDKKTGIMLIHSHYITIVLAVAICFLFDNMKEKRSVPLSKLSGIACFKNCCGTVVKNCCSKWWLEDIGFVWGRERKKAQWGKGFVNGYNPI